MFSIFLLFSRSEELRLSPLISHLKEKPKDTEHPYAIFFRNFHCPHCHKILPVWNKSAETGAGLAKFADVNCDEARRFCRELKIDGVPKIFVLKNGKSYQYPDNFEYHHLKITEWISQFTDFTTKFVSLKNFSKIISKKAVILFSKKMPKAFTAAERYYDNKEVKFFISSDEKLAKELKLEKFPCVYVKDGNKYTAYEGKINAIPIKEFVDSTLSQNNEL